MKLQDYIRGKRKGKEARGIELDAMSDPFLDEAIEGYDAVDTDHKEALERLSARLAGRIGAPQTAPVRRIPLWRRPAVVASVAAIFVCLVITGLLYRQTILPGVEGQKYAAAPADTSAYPAEVRGPEKTVEAEEAAISREEVSVVTNIETVLNDAPASIIIADFSEEQLQINVPDEITVVSVSEVEEIMMEDNEKPRIRGIASILPRERSEIAATPPQSSQSAVKLQSSPVAVSGTVLDSDGLPLPGATVSIPGTGSGTITDLEGKFNLSSGAGASVIQVNYLGYKPAALNFQPGQHNFTILLEEDNNSLDEVVVVGYGTQKKQSYTGSVSKIGNEMKAKRAKREIAAARDSKSEDALVAQDAEQYYPGADGFAPVGSSPVSSFGFNMQGDIYRKIRNAIKEGQRPEAQTVRVEEMVNHFSYGYSYLKPFGKDDLTINYEIGECPWNKEHKLVLIAITAGDKPINDAVLNVEFNSEALQSYRLVGYDTATYRQHYVPEFDSLAQNENVVALYEIVPQANTSGRKLITLDISYREQGSRKSRKLQTEVLDTGAAPSADFYFASAVAMFGELLRGSPFLQGADFDLVEETAMRGVTQSASGTRQEFLQLVRSAKELYE